jgi:hypothetical protein
MAEVRPRIFSAARVAEMADAVVPATRTNVPDNLAVDSARDAVLQLEVHLGNRVFGDHRGVRDITCAEASQRNCLEVSAVGVVESRNVRMAADSTMLRMVNRLMALSLGVHLEQLEHRMGLTWPRPAKIPVSD